ncbi:MAG: hypothetical protein AAGA48_21545, partial [Myxococcota bacterium]
MNLLAFLLLACTSSETSDSGSEPAATTLADATPRVVTRDGTCDGEPLVFDEAVSGNLPGGWATDLGDWFTDGQVGCTPFPAEFPGPYSA